MSARICAASVLIGMTYSSVELGFVFFLVGTAICDRLEALKK